MPILCYEISGTTGLNPRSTTGAEDGHIAAVLKGDHNEANAQVYSELVANRLAMFLGIPVVMGVPARGAHSGGMLRFAALRAAEAGLDVYDFTVDDNEDPDENDAQIPEGVYRNAGHVNAITALCAKYPMETASIAVFDLWIGNQDRPLNFKAELNSQRRGIIFALDQGSSILACRANVDSSLLQLEREDFPSFHPFQKLLNPLYCGGMVERISNIPDWALLAAATYDDSVGSVTLDEQYAAYTALHGRKQFLGELVDRVLF